MKFLTFEENVERSLSMYPALYQKRTQVLKDIFCSLGNGYEWYRGRLICGWEDKTPEQLKENTFVTWRRALAHRDQILEKKVFTGLSEEEQLIFLEKKYADMLERTKNAPVIWNRSFTKEYSAICNFTRIITLDWLEGIIETCNEILNTPADSIERLSETDPMLEIVKNSLKTAEKLKGQKLKRGKKNEKISLGV